VSGVPERDLVNNCLAAARDRINALPLGDNRTQNEIHLYLVEALVRQIRDADDTQFEIAQRVEAGFADLGVILGSIEIPRSHEPTKRGLFS
jgi:hypothetical protein